MALPTPTEVLTRALAELVTNLRTSGFSQRTKNDVYFLDTLIDEETNQYVFCYMGQRIELETASLLLESIAIKYLQANGYRILFSPKPAGSCMVYLANERVVCDCFVTAVALNNGVVDLILRQRENKK